LTIEDLWLRSPEFEGHVTAALERDQTGGETYAAQDIPVVKGEWRKYEFTLEPRQSDPLAKLALLFYGRGRVWVDQVSLMPRDAVDGVRADVFQRIKAVRPGFLRWPGGNVAQDYHWMWGIGPRDERTTWINLSWGNEPEPSDFGTDEYLQFCRNLGATPTLVVNVDGRGATAQEAAAWVEYVNGPESSKYGSMRVRTWPFYSSKSLANGLHPRPASYLRHPLPPGEGKYLYSPLPASWAPWERAWGTPLTRLASRMAGSRQRRLGPRQRPAASRRLFMKTCVFMRNRRLRRGTPRALSC
jgi:hypothetical protein